MYHSPVRAVTRREWLWGLPVTGAYAQLRSGRSSGLKITKFVTHKIEIARRQFLFLEVRTDGGLVGLGEASLPARVDIVEEALRWLESRMVGRDPSGVEEHWDRVYYRENRWRHGAVLVTAQSAVDIALWDLEGKALGVPVWRLLGGPLHKALRVYYSHWDTGVRPRTPETLAQHAVETRRQGWTAVKMIPQQGGTEVETVDKLVAELDAIRKAVGNSLDIGLELVERFSTRSAIALARAVAPYRPMFLEEATLRENPGAMRELADKSPVPLAGGEGLLNRYDFRHLLEARGAAIIQPDVIHCGGITEMRKIANLAEIYGVEIAPHQWYGPIAHVASLHAASVCRNFLIQEWDGARDEVFASATAGTCPRQRGGVVELPEAPGLGLRVDFDEFKRRFPFR
jgi:galactonate dehydratase